MNKRFHAKCGILALFLALTVFLAPPVQAGDRTVVLLPLVIFADQSNTYLRRGLQSMFISRLAGEGLDVIGGEALLPLLKEGEKQGVNSEERAEELARQLKTKYAVFGSVTALGGGYSLDMAILDLTKASPKLTRVSEAMEENQLIPKLADVAYQFRAVIEGKDINVWRRAGLPGALPDGQTPMGLFFRETGEGYNFQPAGSVTLRRGIHSFDAGDLDNDERIELLFMSRDKLFVYHKEDKVLVLKDAVHASRGESFFKVSVGDADRNGRPEIYLAANYGKRARTTVYEWSGQFRKLFDMMGHLVVIRDQNEKGKPLLLYQDSVLNRYFSGNIYRMEYDSSKEPTKAEPLPEFEKGIQFYSLAFADLNGDGAKEFLGLSENGYLHVWDSTGKSLWNSNDIIGGTNNAVTVGEEVQTLMPPTFYFNSSPIVVDIDNDGNREVLAIHNIPMSKYSENLRIYFKAKLNAYKIAGTTLVPTWSTRTMRHSLSDVRKVGDTLYLVGLKTKFSNIANDVSRIMWFE